MNPSSRTSGSDTHETCRICLEQISVAPNCSEEEKRQLDCSHIFHRECIGEWLKQKHNCPLCRAHVEVNTAEARRPEMTIEEILAVPDTLTTNSPGIVSFPEISIEETLVQVREVIQEIRRVRRLDLNEITPVADTARKVHSIASRIFRF